MPVYATLFVIATLASVGLPGDQRLRRRVHGHHRHVRRRNTLGHFNGIQAVGAAIGVILGAVYMLRVVQKMFFGPITQEGEQAPRGHQRRESSSPSRRSSMMIFVIGLFPNIFLSRIKDAVARVESDFDDARPR